MEVMRSCMALLLINLLVVARQHSCAASRGGGGRGFTVDLIHRDSARSPLYNSSLSAHDRLRAAVRRSNARAAALYDAAAVGRGRASGVVSEIVSKTFEFLMTINVGTPPNKILAIADTGSDLIWVDCAGRRMVHPWLFDPSGSSTYGVVPCKSDVCQELPEESCDASSNCAYVYNYGDGSQTSGVVSTETFTFDSAVGDGKGPVRVPNVTFGCSTTSTGSFRASGLVGLGGGPVSLVSQLGDASFARKFSYCLTPYSNNSTDASSVLNFGSNAVVSEPNAVTTLLVASAKATYYTVTLDAVKVGGEAVTRQSSTTIVDSGTTLTYLDDDVVQALIQELSPRIKLPRASPPDETFQLCYDVSGVGAGQPLGIPNVVFEFAGAPVTLTPTNTFVIVEQNTLCLAITAARLLPTAILGNIAQQNFHVGYDLEKRTVTFAATDCTKL